MELFLRVPRPYYYRVCLSSVSQSFDLLCRETSSPDTTAVTLGVGVERVGFIIQILISVTSIVPMKMSRTPATIIEDYVRLELFEFLEFSGHEA